KSFAAFVDDYFDAFFEWNPSTATVIGFHQYDGKLEELSQRAIHRRIDRLKDLQADLIRFRAEQLSTDEAIDAEIIESQLEAEVLDLETLGTWRQNPMIYVGLPGNAVDNLMKRDFAPKVERLRCVVSRIRGVPALIEAMRANVENPPHEFTDLAIRIAKGSA